MKHTHSLFLILCRKRFYYRAYKDFQQTAAHSVDADGNKESGRGIGQKLRQDWKADEPGSRCGMSDNHGSPVADPVDKSCREKVSHKLYDKIN